MTGGKFGDRPGRDTSRKVPVLLAVERQAPDGSRRWQAWCPFCRRLHVHSPEPGHRVAHCADDASPFRETGYVLRPAPRGGHA